MNNLVGIPFNCPVFFLIFNGFINIHKYYNKIICIFDHLVNMLYLSINFKQSSVLYDP